MKSKEFWEKAERLAVVFAAFLGAIAFFWQLVEYNLARQERVDLILWCRVEAGEMKLVAEVVNTSSKVVYLKGIEFLMASPTSETRATYPITPALGSENSRLTPIEVGESKEFEIMVSRDSIQSLANEERLFVIARSPSRKMRRVGNLAPYLGAFMESADYHASQGIYDYWYECIK